MSARGNGGIGAQCLLIWDFFLMIHVVDLVFLVNSLSFFSNSFLCCVCDGLVGMILMIRHITTVFDEEMNLSTYMSRSCLFVVVFLVQDVGKEKRLL